MPSSEVLENTSRVPVVSQPPGLQVQAGGWVKERGMSASLLGLGVVAAAAFVVDVFHEAPHDYTIINIIIASINPIIYPIK